MQEGQLGLLGHEGECAGVAARKGKEGGERMGGRVLLSSTLLAIVARLLGVGMWHGCAADVCQLPLEAGALSTQGCKGRCTAEEVQA